MIATRHVTEKRIAEVGCRCVLDVFDAKLKTDQAKETICKHLGENFGVQMVCKEIKAFAEKSTGVNIEYGESLGHFPTIQYGSPQLTETHTRSFKSLLRQFRID